MKNLLVTVLFTIGMVSHAHSLSVNFSDLHEKWRSILNENGVITEPLYFSKTAFFPDLTVVITEMEQNRVAMADWMLAGIAVADQPIDYKDERLLKFLCGFDFYPRYNNSRELDRQQILRVFQSEWKNGTIADPHQKILSLLAQLKSKESADMSGLSFDSSKQQRLSELEERLARKDALTTEEGTEFLKLRMRQRGVKLTPEHILELRHYGMYALPALISAVKTSNSAYAFAAILLITGNNVDVYPEFIKHPDSIYETSEKKLSFIKTCWSQINEPFDANPVLRDRIIGALE